jgi:uncharacterized protein YjiS (DUF1127 family)
MATTELTHSQTSQIGERIQHVIEVSAARVAAVWQAAKNRRDVNRLLEWDDRMLRDIGLTQNDVRAALSGTVAEDPSSRLSLLSSERRAADRAARREATVVVRASHRRR